MTNGIEPPEWARDTIRRSHDRMTEAVRDFHISMGGSEETFEAILAAQAKREATVKPGAVHESAVPERNAARPHRCGMTWQPIETAPPETDARFLVFAEGEVVIGYRNSFYGGVWWQCEDEGPLNWGAIEPTHWMPLPKPPKDAPND